LHPDGKPYESPNDLGDLHPDGKPRKNPDDLGDLQ